jgi:hypothetical protein
MHVIAAGVKRLSKGSVMKWFTCAVAAALLLAAAPGCNKTPKPDPEETSFISVMEDYSTGTAAMVTKGAKFRYEYCPDNTCEMFESGKCSAGPMDDFALIYLYGVSRYVYLQRFQTEARPLIEKIAGKHTNCRSADFGDRIRCLLEYLSTKCDIKLYFRRFDEGEMCEQEVDLAGKEKGTTDCKAEKKAPLPEEMQ